MFGKRSLLILSICLLLFGVIYAPLTIAYSQPLLEVEVSGYYLVAGEENQIEISVTNVGGTSAYEVKASLSAPQTVSGIAIVDESHRVFDEIEEEETKHIYPVLYVASSLPLGAYSLTLGLEYYDAKPRVVDREKHVSNIEIGVVVDAIRPTKLALDVDVGDYRVTAGVENEISIILTNVGEEAVYDVEAELTSTSPGIVVLKETSHLFDGEVNVWDQISFRPLLGISRNIALGSYPITLTLDYKDSSGVTYRDNVTVGIFVDSVEPTDRTTIVVQEFRVVPSDIRPGDRLTLEMELKNLGSDAHDVQVQLITGAQSPITSLSPTLVFVGDLVSNKINKIIYDLQVNGDAKAQPYMLQLTVSYYDVYGQPTSITENISIDVRSIISFNLINVQPSSLTLETGEIVTVEADLLLIGTETVQFVQVEILENHPFLLVSESYEYIGRVDPDSPVPFDVQFTVDPNAKPGNYTLQMRVSYWDEYNRELQEIEELPFVVENRVEKGEESALSFWDQIWRTIRILLGMKP